MAETAGLAMGGRTGVLARRRERRFARRGCRLATMRPVHVDRTWRSMVMPVTGRNNVNRTPAVMMSAVVMVMMAAAVETNTHRYQ